MNGSTIILPEYQGYLLLFLMSCFISSDGNNGVINNGLTALFFSVTSNQINYCFPRYNTVTITDNKMQHYYNLL